MAATVIGRRSWVGKRDSEGHRDWTVEHKVRTSDKNDGPSTVMQCGGLPQIGSTYNFGNDVDIYAWCYPDMDVQMLEAKDDNTMTWLTRQRFSTRPMYRCNTLTIQNPILEPQKMGGSFFKFVEEATQDMNGAPLLSSSFELFRGKGVEFDANRPNVWIEQNVTSLGLDTFSQFIDCVNDSTLWNLPPRCVKLSNVVWQRKLFGICSYYYTRRFEFDINYNTFDRYIQDEGTRVLNGHWGSTTGSGCTVNINTVGKSNKAANAVTGVTINAAGTGYPASQNVTLAITGGGGVGASIVVATDGSGTVTSVVSISVGGQGYSVTTGASTTGSIWVLDKINGNTPDPTNPQHFIRYKDLNGDYTRVILDGNGQPAVGRWPGIFLVQKYQTANLLLLGIPTVLSV